jgi:hypothetical protein
MPAILICRFKTQQHMFRKLFLILAATIFFCFIMKLSVSTTSRLQYRHIDREISVALAGNTSNNLTLSLKMLH